MAENVVFWKGDGYGKSEQHYSRLSSKEVRSVVQAILVTKISDEGRGTSLHGHSGRARIRRLKLGTLSKPNLAIDISRVPSATE